MQRLTFDPNILPPLPGDYRPDWNHVWLGGGGYYVVKCPSHPHVWKYANCVAISRVVAEAKLGRLLRTGEIVHHRNGNRRDDRPENIEVLKGRAEHIRIHAEARREDIVCEECGYKFRRPKSIRKNKYHVFCSRTCAGRFLRRRQLETGTGPHRSDSSEKTVAARKLRRAKYMKERYYKNLLIEMS